MAFSGTQADLNAIQYHFEKYSGDNESTTTSATLVTKETIANIKPFSEKADWRFFAAFGCLCLINLMCALDATILSVALPVRIKLMNLTLC